MSGTFSPTDAALEGFRVLRRRPDTLFIWAGLVILTSAVGLGLIWTVLAPDFASLVSALQSRVSPAALQPVAEKVRGTELLLTPLTATLHAVLGTAVLRAVLRPDSRNFGYLGFGGDEFRMFLVQMVYGLILAGATFVWILFVITFTAIGIAAAGLHSAEIGQAILGAVILGVVAGGIGLFYLSIRLSLAAPMSFLATEFRFFESWGQTRGQVWRLAGTYVLAYFLYLVASMTLLVVGIVLGGIVFFASGGAAVLSDHSDLAAVARLAWPAVLVGLVPVSMASVISAVVLQAPAARALRGMTPDVA